MVAHTKERGFTVVEMVVALIVMSIFMTLFFQLYMTSESQRLAVVRRAAAADIAATNLHKIGSKGLIPASITCNSTASSPNSLTNNPSLVSNPDAGSTIPWAGSLQPESLDGTNLPSGTTQILRVVYPRGCNVAYPVKIISTVTFGTESVRRATFVN